VSYTCHVARVYKSISPYSILRW